MQANPSDPAVVLPRAVGVRRDYGDIPAEVRAWVESALGDSVIDARSQPGGMSPGCAARLRTQSGRRAFVKAVGSDLNPGTPDLFRREIDVLAHLEPVPYRPRVIATYDDGQWVALLLDDVDGRYPDLDDRTDADAVWATVGRQTRELTPAPGGLNLRTLADVMTRNLLRWELLCEDPHAILPGWAADRVDDLHHRVSTLPDRLPVESLCHWDVRDDNLLIRPDGTVVVIDWGMACLGPSWADLVFLALSWAGSTEFDDRIAGIAPGPDRDDVTDLVLLFGATQAWVAHQPAPPGLANLPAFCRREATRLLEGARRRLGVDR